jgi:hypothetical protein
MTTRIAYNSSNGVGKATADFVAEVQAMLAKGRRLKSILDSASFGSDWAAVEAAVGCTAGQGQNFWTIVATAMQNLDSGAVGELSRLDQG